MTDPNTTASDLVHTVAVVAGDVLTFKAVKTNTPASAVVSIGYTLDPTTDGEFPIHGGTQTIVANATRYILPGMGATAQQATESASTVLWGGCTIKKLYVELQSSPGAGKSLVVTLRKNASDQALTCTLTATTTGNDVVNSFTTVAGDRIVVKYVLTIGATTSVFRLGMVGYIAPTGGWSNISRVKGITAASMSKMLGVAVASISKVKGKAV
jgi:hypothetical protein